MRVLVFGGRDYAGDVSCLDMIDISILIHGAARGADIRAAKYVQSRGIHAAAVPALWDNFGRAAGHLRNEAMTLLQPEYAVKFPGGRGTEDMKRRVLELGIPLWEPYG